MSDSEELERLRSEVHALKCAPEPRAFELAQWADWQRLIREVRGYLHTCIREHHGTDRRGREHAEDALSAMQMHIDDFIQSGSRTYSFTPSGKYVCPCCGSKANAYPREET